jgi:MFS family permease
MTAAQPHGATAKIPDMVGEVCAVEPEAVIVQAAVAVRGHAVELGWEGLGGRFGRYLTAATLSFYGDWLTTVALVVLLYRLSGPAAPAGYMVARVLPRLVSGGPGGGLADRFQPHRVVAVCSTVQGLTTLAIIPAARIGAVWAVYGAVVVAQFAGGLAKPALGALVPRVAPPQRLQRANALYSLGFSSSIAVGPALAAPLLSATGPEALLLIDAVTFGIAAVLMLTLSSGRPATAVRPTRRGIVLGFRAVWEDPGLRALAASWLASAISVTAASSVLVLIAHTFGDAALVGYLYAAVGAGAVLMGFVVLRWRPPYVGRDVIVGVAVVEVLCLALVTLHGPFWAAVVPLALNGAGGVMWQTWGATDMQLRSHPAFLGRVNAVILTSSSLGMLVGALLALALVPTMGWQHTLFIACCVALTVLAAGVVAGPQRATAPSR